MSAEAQREWIRNEVPNGLGLSCTVGFVVWFFTAIILFATQFRDTVPMLPALFVPTSFVPTVIIQIGWYFLALPTSPYFARGIGYSLLVSLAFLLGLTALCHG